jgi:hypothetical protein
VKNKLIKPDQIRINYFPPLTRIYGKEIDSDKVQATKIIDGVFKNYKLSPKLVPERKAKA